MFSKEELELIYEVVNGEYVVVHDVDDDPEYISTLQTLQGRIQDEINKLTE